MVYSARCELKERSAELQKCIEDAEHEGDLRKADSFRDELQSIEERLLEKNEERKAKYVLFCISIRIYLFYFFAFYVIRI